MNLIGETVVHLTLGTGTIVRQETNANENDYIWVSIDGIDRSFSYPHAFKQFLTLKDSAKQALVLAEIPPPAPPVVIRRPEPTDGSGSRGKSKSRRKVHHPGKPEAANLAIKCTRNDGGATHECLGFRGVCSDEMIRYNILKEEHVWCSQPECPCRQYLNKELSRGDLEEIYRLEGFICYDSEYFKYWTAYAGFYHNGDRKGEPKRFKYADVNQLSVFTTRDPHSAEEKRYIIGVALIQSLDPGNDFDCGIAEAHPVYRLALTPEEAHQMLFWKYYANTRASEHPRWGSGLYRYLTDEVSAQILRDITTLKRRTKDQDLAEAFLKKFCELTDQDPMSLPKPLGALNLAKYL